MKRQFTPSSSHHRFPALLSCPRPWLIGAQTQGPIIESRYSARRFPCLPQPLPPPPPLVCRRNSLDPQISSPRLPACHPRAAPACSRARTPLPTAAPGYSSRHGVVHKTKPLKWRPFLRSAAGTQPRRSRHRIAMTRALRQDSAPSRSCLARKMARRCLPLQVTMLAAAFAEVLLTAARARSQQLESENSRLRELLHAYMSSDGGKLVHTLDWCDAYLRGESTEGLEWESDDSGSESSS